MSHERCQTVEIKGNLTTYPRFWLLILQGHRSEESRSHELSVFVLAKGYSWFIRFILSIFVFKKAWIVITYLNRWIFHCCIFLSAVSVMTSRKKSQLHSSNACLRKKKVDCVCAQINKSSRGNRDKNEIIKKRILKRFETCSKVY